jgi:hypothetical protein
MTNLDTLIASELDRMLPLPSGGRADWQEVVDRAAFRRRRTMSRRRLVSIAAAATVAALLVAVTTPVGAAVVRGLDGFASWISGDPGQPASPAEQKAFQQANERSWSGFASGTALRRLIQTSASGTSYTLFGFRSGDQLCLRLVASGVVSGTRTRCAPLQALQTAKEPALVVAVDEPFESTSAAPNDEGDVPDAASASFGIVSDGITKVLLHADDGTHNALVASNAFLYLADHLRAGVRVRSALAVAGDGSSVALPFQSAPFGTIDLPQPPKGTAQGPAKVEHRVSGGTIGWLDAREPRGEPLPAELRRFPEKVSGSYVFGRLIQPDPESADRVGVTLTDGSLEKPSNGEPGLCTALIASGDDPGWAVCGHFSRRFQYGPLDVLSGSSGAGQFSVFSGLASDDVAQIKLFLASGETVDVPLKDNAFIVRAARASFPARLVAYDDQQRVIDVHTYQSDGATNPAPWQARASVHEFFRIRAGAGHTLIVRAGDTAGGVRCTSFRLSDPVKGDSVGGGCSPWPLTDMPQGNPLTLIAAWEKDSGNNVFLSGMVPDRVASVTVTFPDGYVGKLTLKEGLVGYLVPAAELAGNRTLLVFRAYDKSGAQLAQRGLRIRS